MKQLLILFLILFLIPNALFSQKKYEIRTAAFYNLENLFDTENDTLINDEASPIMEIKENREVIYQQKLKNMAKVISEIGLAESNNSPVILGVA